MDHAYVYMTQNIWDIEIIPNHTGMLSFLWGKKKNNRGSHHCCQAQGLPKLPGGKQQILQNTGRQSSYSVLQFVVSIPSRADLRGNIIGFLNQQGDEGGEPPEFN